MNDLKVLARKAKQRLASGFWQQCKQDVDLKTKEAEQSGLNAGKVKCHLYGKVKDTIRGQKEDEFYLKVKKLLDEYGEVSDAIGRLTDKEYFDTLSYSEKQRYTMELSTRYLEALEKYRKEKEVTVR
ncbi:MAG: hypothetical protein ACI4MQ_06285 [Candidatus Coproplasma sp.]